MRMKTFVINRKKWYRGMGGSYSRLLLTKDTFGSDDSKCIGKMCCLGFACKSLGCNPKLMENVSDPSEIDRKEFNGPDWLFELTGKDKKTSDMAMLIDINDAIGTKRSVRESKIREIFKRNGIKVVFR